MLWFKKKTSSPISVQSPTSSRVELEIHKDATKEAKAKVDDANQKLNDLLVENGFTLKIYLATGGNHGKRG